MVQVVRGRTVYMYVYTLAASDQRLEVVNESLGLMLSACMCTCTAENVWRIIIRRNGIKTMARRLFTFCFARDRLQIAQGLHVCS